MRRNRFPAPNGVNALVGLRLEMNLVRADAQRPRQRLAHLWKMRPELWLLHNHHGIDVFNRELLLIQQLLRMLQKEHAVRALPLRIAVRKMCSDIAKPCGPQQRIAHRMRQHIPIRMSHRPLIERQFNPANNKRPPLFKPVQVVPDTYLASLCSSCLSSPIAVLDPPCKVKTESDEKNQRRYH